MTTRRIATLYPLLLALVLLPAASFAATPSYGSISPRQATPTTFIGGVPLAGAAETGGEANCIEGTTCEQYTLTVTGQPADWTGHKVQLEFSWLLPATEYDLYVHQGTLAGPLVASYTAGLTADEFLTLDPTDSAIGTGVFAVHVVIASGSTVTDNYTAKITSIAPPAKPSPAVQATGLAPQYQVHFPTPAQIAAGVGTSSGEPSIGVNWNTGAILYQAVLQTLKETADDSCRSTPTLTWQQVQSPVTGTETFDPILFTDHDTGRTQISQLVAFSTASISNFTDDDGATYTQSQGSGVASGYDHQTIGGGPFHAPLPYSGAVYAHAVYYCGQANAIANCALSVDGGLTFGPAVPISNSTQCKSLHGHIKVGPDGSAYVPNDSCGGTQAVIASQDNGITWVISHIPGSSAGSSDPSVAVDRGGRLYFGYADGDARAVVAMSNDHGATFDRIVDVGALQNIRAVEFAEMVAGDPGRAAFMFLGSIAPGNPQDPAYPGVWHVYVASTFDGGQTWFTQDVTPNAPVQRGPIWNGGGAVAYRNLLDFNDATYDKRGKFVAAVAQGCQGACVLATGVGNGYSSQASIVRQTGGRGLLGAYDPPGPTEPGAPQLTVVRNGPNATLSWNQSSTGGSPITGYAVQRGTAAGSEITIVQLPGSASGYVDTNLDPATIYYYRIIATNAYGSNCGTDEVAAGYAGDSCKLPGLTVDTNPAGTQVGAPATNTQLNVRAVSVAEPYYTDGSQKLTFTMKVDNLATLPPSANWRMIWTTARSSTNYLYVAMNTDQSSAVTFEYGQVSVQSEVVVGVSTFNSLGVPDAASYKPDGTIQITVADARLATKPGDLLGNLVGRTYLAGVSQTSKAAIDKTGPGNYLVLGNEYCNPANFSFTNVVEDDDPRIDYDHGWHQVANPAASKGHYHYSHAEEARAELNFTVPSSRTGAITLNYGFSAMGGGTAALLLDGVPRRDVSFGAGHGNGRDISFGSHVTLSNIAPGRHTLALVNDDGGAINLDNLVLTNGTAGASDDGTEQRRPTGEDSGTAGGAGGADAISVLAVDAPLGGRLAVLTESDSSGPFQLSLIDPLGNLTAVMNSQGGHGNIDTAVPLPGVYTVQLVNLGLTPIGYYRAITVTKP